MITSKLRKSLDRKEWEMVVPAPATTASGTFIAYDGAEFDKEALFVSGTAVNTAYFYNIEQDAWVNAGNPAWGGTTPSLVGSCGAFTWRGPTSYTAMNIYSSLNNVLATPLAINANLNGFMVRLIGGTGAGQERTITKTIRGQLGLTVTTTATSYTCTLTSGNISDIFPGMIITGNANIPTNSVVASISATANTFTILTPNQTTTGIAAGTSVATNFGGILYVAPNWGTVPDGSTVYTIYSGRWYYNMSAATLANTSIAFYDRATAIWQTGATVGTAAQPGWGTALAATYLGGLTTWGTDGQMVATPSNDGLNYPQQTGVNYYGVSNKVYDTSKNWSANNYQAFGDCFVVTSGTGVGQVRYCVGNGYDSGVGSYVLLNTPLTTPLDGTSTYALMNTNPQTVLQAQSGTTATAINIPSITNSNVVIGMGAKIIAGTGVGQIGLVTANTATTLTVSGITQADSTSLIALIAPGTYWTTLGSPGSNYLTPGGTFTSGIFAYMWQLVIIGGTGAGQVRTITSNNTTTWYVSPAWSPTPDASSIFCLVPIGNASGNQGFGVVTGSTGTTVTSSGVSYGKQWETNQWTGYQIRFLPLGADAGTIRQITSNTANTITVTVPFQTSGFAVTTTTGSSTGTLTTGSTTSLVPGMLISGNGNIPTSSTVSAILSATTFQINTVIGNLSAITAGTAVATTFGVLPSSPYVIEPCDDFLYIQGNNAVAMYRMDLSNLLRPGTAPTFVTVTATTARAGAPVAGATMNWIGSTPHPQWKDETNIINGRRIYSFRSGATATLDYYDIALQTWVSGLAYKNQAETFTTGTKSSESDGEIYIQKDATGRMFRYNVYTNELEPWSTLLFPPGAGIIGNTQFNRKVVDGDILKFVYHLENTSTNMFRTSLIDKVYS